MSVFPDFDYPPLASYTLTGAKIAPVPITLVSNLPTQLSVLCDLISHIEFLPLQCYRNARLIANLSDSQVPFPIHYVEGECLSSDQTRIIFHAWNYLPALDLYFDATWEKLEPHSLDSTYYPIIRGSLPELKIKYPRTAENSAFWAEWLVSLMPQLDESSPYWWQLLEQELEQEQELVESSCCSVVSSTPLHFG